MTTIHARSAMLPEGWADDVRLTLAEGVISAVASGVRPMPGDERAAVLVPAVPNLHSHAFQRAMAGLAERRGPGPDSFWSWRDTMYRFAQSIDPDQCEAVAAQAYVEMLEAGFGRVGEFHYLHHDVSGHPYANIAELAGRIAAASAETGIGLTLLPVFYAHSGFGGRAPDQRQRRFINTVDKFARLVAGARDAIRDLPGAVIGIAPHSLRAVTEEELSAVLPLADGGPLHIHVAEQVGEVEDCVATTGARPVAWLLDHAPVDRRWCLIHATHMTDVEARRAAASGAVAGLCPITEANLGDGIFPAAFLQASGAFGVGSDSNVLISLAAELRQLEYSERLALRARNVVAQPDRSTGDALVSGAVNGGGRALGWAGGLAVGRPADLVALDMSAVPYLRRQAALDAWIFTGKVRADRVWVGGRRLVENGRHLRRDAIENRFQRAMSDLMAAS